MTSSISAPPTGMPQSVGIVGSGFIGREHALSWRQLGLELHVFGGARSEELAREFGASHHTTIEELIAAVDLVDVCLPTHLHRDAVLAAAAGGKHVICEKPLAPTVEDSIAMLEACETAGVRLFVGQVVRYFPEYAAAREAVLAGTVGQPAVLRLARESFLPQRGADDWVFDQALSGGIVGDLMTHDIDYALWTAGPVVRAYARTVSSTPGGIRDHAYAVLTHESGALTHLTASWAQVAPRFRTRIDIAGSEGMLAYDSEKAAPIVVNRRATDSAAPGEVGLPGRAVAGLVDDPFTAQFRDFLRAIAAGNDARSTPAESVETVRVSVAVQESVRTGRAIEMAKELA